MKKISCLFILASTQFLLGCANINASNQEINNPNQGTAQTGDPTIFEHRD
ncbi:MAG: hypothetical protein QG651_738 [Pseudomonadota bacterium]|jgi:hypothetical protein|nr:hypothetical protein [Burkholderiales bacterium]MBP9769806.1 hypothetical protein [Burkholderiales bacterium]MDQ5948244.1 hypothetical protein [Pseudomonadota bacterium]